jgi:hypothetical protein
LVVVTQSFGAGFAAGRVAGVDQRNGRVYALVDTASPPVDVAVIHVDTVD